MPDLPRKSQLTTDQTGDFVAASTPGDPARSATSGSLPGLRFRLLRAHAQGGLGKVGVAQDLRLRREVAVKEIRPDVDSPMARLRFVNEAEITGRLEHPGIVPIYALEFTDDGKPFYAMRFVQGRTMADAIRQYHKAPTMLAFADLLRRLAAVCQTIAYAHSKGVLHRDLKPANIMLGDYGETLVLDWGLAKNVADTDSDDLFGSGLSPTTAAADTLQEVGALTRPGQVVGTPAYASPEQATGGKVGPGTDVFALGAILFEVLTGRPPYQGPDALTILQLAQRGQPPGPGQVHRGVPRPLDAVCRKALAHDPAARYASPAEIGMDIDRWLADEPVSAEPEPITQRVRRLLKRHRVKVSVFVAALLVALPLAVILYVQTKLALERTSSAERQATANLRIASSLNLFLNEELLDSEVIRHRGREATLFEIVETAAPAIDKRFAEHADVRAHVQHSVGNMYDRLGESERALPYLEAALAYHAGAVGEDHVDTRKVRSDLAATLMSLDRLAEAEALFRKVLEADDRDGAPKELGNSLIAMGEVLTLQDRLDEAEEFLRKGVAHCRSHLGAEDLLTLSGLAALSKVRYQKGEIRESEQLDRQVLAGRLKQLPEDHFEVLEARNNLATSLLRLEQHEEAARMLAEVLATCRRVKGQDHPHTIMTVGNLAQALSKSTKPEEAEPLYQEAIARTRAAQPDDVAGLAVYLAHFGDFLVKQKRYGEAESALRESLTLRRQCLKPGHWLTGQVESRLGSSLTLLGRYEEAEPLLLEGQAILEKAEHATAAARAFAIERLVTHYEATGNATEAARWRSRLPKE